MQIIRASRDLEAGTELFFGYRAPQDLEAYADVQKGLTSWGFTCVCELCGSREQTTAGALARRRVLHKKLATLMKGPRGTNVAGALQVLAQMEETYPSGPCEIRLELWDPYFALGAVELSRGQPAECVRMIVKGLESLGFVIAVNIPTGGGVGKKKKSSPASFKITQWGFMTDMIPWGFLRLLEAYKALGASEDVLVALKEYAGVAYSVLVGERETLGEEFPQLA